MEFILTSSHVVRAVTDFQKVLFFRGDNFIPRSLTWKASKLIAISKGVFTFAYRIKTKKLKILTGSVVKLLQERSTTVALGNDACGRENNIGKELAIIYSKNLDKKFVNKERHKFSFRIVKQLIHRIAGSIDCKFYVEEN